MTNINSSILSASSITTSTPTPRIITDENILLDTPTGHSHFQDAISSSSRAGEFCDHFRADDTYALQLQKNQIINQACKRYQSILHILIITIYS